MSLERWEWTLSESFGVIEGPAGPPVPRIIWMLWLQGWSQAPEVAHASRASWARNPGWALWDLDRASLERVIPTRDLERILATTEEPAALSDLVRLELLHRYGGVWADATTVCARPLDRWLPEVMTSGFFALADPGPGRPLSSWFLAAEKGSLLVEQWRQAAIDYWRDRKEIDDYFWLHRLFADCLRNIPGFEAQWSRTPRHSARHRFHFGPGNAALSQPPSGDLVEEIAGLAVPVLKLTHKDVAPVRSGSLLEALVRLAHEGAGSAPGRSTRRLLLAWYGSFAGHGTIGDLRSLEALATHLVGRGHQVAHATAGSLDIPGAERVHWETVDLPLFDAAVFVCGPVLKQHAQTRRLFARLAECRLAGVGVSLMPEDSPQHLNPFEMVLAREGGQKAWGDIAILAPLHDGGCEPHGSRLPTVGLSLRGRQGEYGLERCASGEAKALLTGAAEAAAGDRSAEFLQIQNHLAQSGQAPHEIEELYRRCGLILTTRFHGAICALRHGVPFIAIDQIRGGAKVKNLLDRLGWPHVYGIDQCDPTSLNQVATRLLEGEQREILLEARDHAVKDANRTLDTFDQWIDSL